MNNDIGADKSGLTDTPEHKSDRWFHRRNIVIFVIVLLLLIFVGGWYVYDQQKEERGEVINPGTTRAYSLDEASSYAYLIDQTLQASGDNTALKFGKPVEYLLPDSPLDKADLRLTKPLMTESNNVEFGERILMPDQSVIFQGVVAARIVPLAEQSEFNSYDYFRQLLARLSFAATQDTSQIGMGTSAPAQFTNSNITTGGLIYEISASSLGSGSNSSPVDHMIGQLIEIKAKNANYYLLIAAIDQNWHSSPKTWQAIKDSIKVDQ